MAKRRVCAGSVGAALLIATTLAGPARAQDNSVPDAAAFALFREGRDLIKQGDWDTGCPKLAASMKRYPAASTQLNLALCREHEGKVATAWAMAQRARVINRDTASPSRRNALDGVAAELIERLLPRLPRVRVRIMPVVAGASVREDGRELPLDTAVPLDPGPHTLIARAAGRDDVSRTVSLREGETLAIELRFPEAPAAPAPVPTPSAAPATSSKLLPPPAAPLKRPDAGEAIHPWVWLSGGVGIALGGVAIGFAVDAVNTANTLEERCGEDLICNEDLSFDPHPLNARKNRGTALAIGFGAAGGIGLAAAVIGIILSSDDSTDAPSGESASGAHLSGWASAAGAGLAVQGHF